MLDDFRAKLERHGAGITQSALPKPEAQTDNNGDSVRWPDILGEGNRVKLSGFFRLDLDIDSQRPNNSQVPLFITSKEGISKDVSGGDFSMHPRLTRFGLDYSGPSVAGLGDGKLSGKFEVDFENGGTESRQIIRIRHAYLKMSWKRFSMLAGQTWDVVSLLVPTVNNDTLMWNAGNVGDRRPQLQVAFDSNIGRGKWSFTGAAGLTGAVDAQDLDVDAFRDGEESRRPNL
jgi:hypothetical protein